jgi:hypothetical protein
MNEAGGTFIKKIKSRAHFFYDRFSKKTLAKWLNFENSDGLFYSHTAEILFLLYGMCITEDAF